MSDHRLFLSNRKWLEIRAGFSAAQMLALNAGVVGDVICPPGTSIDPTMLPADLAEKLRAAMR